MSLRAVASVDAENAPPSPRRDAWTSRVAVLVVLAAHGALVAHFAPPAELLSPRPLLDYGLHGRQVVDAIDALASSGRAWAYDPLDLAGRLTGLTTDAGSRGLVLAIVALARAGIDPLLALNHFVLGLHVVVPVIGWRAARLSGLRAPADVVAAAAFSVLWYFDSLVHWQWFTGELGWSLATLATVHAAAALGATVRGRGVLEFGLGAAVVALAQPWAAVPLVIAGGAFLTVSGGRRERGAVLGAAVCGTAIAIGTFLPGIAAAGPARPAVLAPTPDYLITDFFDLLRDPWATGAPVRTVFRFVVLAAAGVVLLRGRTAGLLRTPLAVATWSGVVLAYVGGAVPGLRDTEPHGHVATAAFGAAVLAAPVLVDVLRPSSLAALSATGRAGAALVGLIVAPRVVGTVLQYLPGALPQPVTHGISGLGASPLVGMNEPRPFAMRHSVAPPYYDEIAHRLAAEHGGRGRIFVSEWALAEHLTLRARLPVVGGPVGKLPDGNGAHLLAGDADARIRGPGLVAHLERYAIGLVVLSGPKGPLELRPDVFEPAFDHLGFRVHRVRADPTLVAEGRARVVGASLDSLLVEADGAGPVTLRFHHVVGLACRPDCALESAGGFLRVPSAPRTFEIHLPGRP